MTKDPRLIELIERQRAEAISRNDKTNEVLCDLALAKAMGIRPIHTLTEVTQ